MNRKRNYSKYVENRAACPYYRKGYCMLRDDTCKTSSLKCKKNNVAYKNTSLSLGLYDKETKIRIARRKHNYNPFAEERYGINQKITEITYDENTTRLYVFKGFLNLARENTTDYIMSIEDIWTGEDRKVLVAYNSTKKRYYISYTQLQWLHNNKIYISAKLFECEEGTETMDGTMFNPFSRLALYGYSVGKNGLNDEGRKQILIYIIEHQVMTKSKIISHLQGLISLRENRTDADFTSAISKWKKDIVFVNGYRTKK